MVNKSLTRSRRETQTRQRSQNTQGEGGKLITKGEKDRCAESQRAMTHIYLPTTTLSIDAKATSWSPKSTGSALSCVTKTSTGKKKNILVTVFCNQTKTKKKKDFRFWTVVIRFRVKRNRQIIYLHQVWYFPVAQRPLWSEYRRVYQKANLSLPWQSTSSSP